MTFKHGKLYPFFTRNFYFNNRFLHEFYTYDLRHNSSNIKWQSLGSLFSFNFLVNVTGTFLRCHGHFLVLFPKNVTGIFFVTGKNMRFLSRVNQKLSRSIFAVKIVTCIFSCHVHILVNFGKSVTGNGKRVTWKKKTLLEGVRHIL